MPTTAIINSINGEYEIQISDNIGGKRYRRFIYVESLELPDEIKQLRKILLTTQAELLRLMSRIENLEKEGNGKSTAP